MLFDGVERIPDDLRRCSMIVAGSSKQNNMLDAFELIVYVFHHCSMIVQVYPMSFEDFHTLLDI